MSDPRTDTLAVDLDGTLLRSDMLYESFWAAFRADWRTPLFCGAALLRGRAHLKEYLARAVRLDVTRLPYDAQVVAFARDWRARGGHTALVTATHQDIAEDIAAHLGIFDEVYGTDATRNLKGHRKAAFLQQHFDGRPFAYMGDSAADLAVWPHADRAITVNARPAIRDRAETLCARTEHMHTDAGAGPAHASVLRPWCWLRNLLVFLPLLAAGESGISTLLWAFLGVFCFTLLDAAFGVIHDLLRLEPHRTQVATRNGAFASGRLSIVQGTFLAAGLTTLAGGGALLGGAGFFAVMLAYLLLSLMLLRLTGQGKAVAAGGAALLWPLRVLAGGLLTGSAVPPWGLALAAILGAGITVLRKNRR